MNPTSNNIKKTDACFPGKLNRRRVIVASCAVILAGYLLMLVSGSTEHSFNPEIFSFRVIVVAPMLCLVGYLMIIVAILYPNSE
ncbi:MAG: DUF3098 domain-containing protein [Bacteroidaceae bacterium]|nr:DUF3098 domain-containing protein [Bacteroidaceae bacterium]